MRKIILIIFLLIAVKATAQIGDPHRKKATVILNNISLEEALTVIGISFGVHFSYSDDVIPTQTKINLNVQDETLQTALENILKLYNIIFKVINGNRIVLHKIHGAITSTVRGTVIDAITHAPLAGGSVILQNEHDIKGTTTNENGIFKIEAAPVGRISLLISNVGYDAQTINSLLVSSGKELVLDVALSESITPIKEVIVTASKYEANSGGNMAITSNHSFNVEETKRYAGSMGDPARMVTAFAGVTSGSDDTNALVIRGNSPRGVLWRVEGIEIPNPNHFSTEGSSSGVVSVLSPNIISNVDFLTGAFPAQYGNALSGVFDIRLREGNNQKHEHSFQAGLLGLEVSTEGPVNKKHKASYLVNYRYSTLSVLDKLGFKLNETGQYKDYRDLSFKINLPTKTGSLSIFGIGGNSVANKNDTTIYDNNLSEVGILGVSYKKMINENTFLQASISYSGTQISKYNKLTSTDSVPYITKENYSKGYIRSSLMVRKRISNMTYLEAGATISQLRYNFFLKTINPNNLSYPVIINFSERERDQTCIMQGYVQSRKHFTPTIFGFYGFHFLYFGLSSDYSIEPRTGLRWQLSQNKSLSLAYGKHSRIENLQYYLARNHQTGGNEIQLNKNIGFTRAHHLGLTFDYAITITHRLKIETYFQQLYNAPVQVNTSSIYSSLTEDTGFITDSLTNKGKGRNFGVELSFEKVFTNNIYYLVNGSVYQSRFTIDNQTEHQSPYNGSYSIHALGGKEFEVGTKRNRLGINFKLTQAGGKRFVPIDLEKSIQQKKQVYNWDEAYAKQLPAYFRTDFQIVYKMNRSHYTFEWRLDIQNLTNHRNSAWYYFDDATQSIKLKKQIGILPLLSCRIDF